MDHLEQSFSVRFDYNVYFTTQLFNISNTLFHDFLKEKRSGSPQKILFVVDSGVAEAHTNLLQQIKEYFQHYQSVQLIENIIIVPGGEAAKNEMSLFNKFVEAVNKYGIDRHSYIAAIGGGSVLDLVGFASAVSHRGIKHIRIPTTVLSQNDSGIGVKNGINYEGKKNFIGSFAPPVAVFNDDAFLLTLSDRDWRSGISEAIKVALIKDAVFFKWIEDHADELANRDLPVMNELIKRCAQLHLEHIASGDPFEMGSSRPLDFGHWSAHKLEQLSNFEVLHGEAVAMGIALDSMYSSFTMGLSEAKAKRIIQLMLRLGFNITHPLMQVENDSPIIAGLQEFQEHLGGRLTIMLLKDIGVGEEVHSIDIALLHKAAEQLLNFSSVKAF
ncbi:MAG: 3-dehydroquinate synthase [Ilyomonas sp.]